MEDSMAVRYWCHMCSQMVNPTNVEVEPKCPLCLSGFVEAMDSTRSLDELTSDHALSLWAPILLNVMGNSRTRRRFRRSFLLGDDNDDDDYQSTGSERLSREEDGETELDRELVSIIRRRRSSSTILQLLHSMRAGLPAAESENDRNRDREHLILTNPFSQSVDVQGGGSYQDENSSQNLNPLGSLGDYFLGPGLDLLLQHLTENDPSRYGTPPAQKDVIEALPIVKLEESLQCSVCLDDFEVGAEALEMPCKHKFHRGCILPWLELHSSCPVCRFQLPADVSKLNLQVVSGNNVNGHGIGIWSNEVGRDNREELDAPSERRFALPWPFSTLFSSSASQANTTTANSSSPESSLSSSSSGAATATQTNGG